MSVHVVSAPVLVLAIRNSVPSVPLRPSSQDTHMHV